MITRGTTEPTRIQRMLDKWRFRLRDRLQKRVTIVAAGETHSFVCNSTVETWRAMTLFSKEAGTVRWIAENVREGDVFYDVGANIGLYTLLAARRVGATGRVYAFEPHVANVQSLLANVAANGLEGRVRVISSALNDKEGWFDFHYKSDVPGTSMSQLGATKDGDEREFRPRFAEYKHATTVDSLVARGEIEPPTHVKLDVDGNEGLIISGMAQTLRTHPPKTFQVEINARYKAQVFALLSDAGFTMRDRHDTLAGQAKIASGVDPESIGYNVVFVRGSAK